MRWCVFKRFIAGCICTLYLPGAVFAAPSDSSWEHWFVSQIKQHPDAIAAEETMNSVMSMAEGRERPLYNPELETEFEREGQDNNYRIGINQTIDWRDKRAVRKQQAGFSRAAARQTFEFTLQQEMADALQALIEWQAASSHSALALQQETQLETLLDLVTERQQAGDLGQVDAELTFLSLSQKLNATAQAQVQLKRVEARLRERLPGWSPERAQIPEQFWPDANPEQTAAWLDAHPAVLAARYEWDVLQQAAELARRETKADPTFGVNAGQTDADGVLAVTFSIPLNVRNNYSAEARAASQQALSAEARYRATRRRQQRAIEASTAALAEFQQGYARWQSLLQGRGERRENLLEKQWRSGDMNTTEYLLTLQQRTEGLVAGIELHAQFQLARLDWLLQTGQINAALTRLKQ